MYNQYLNWKANIGEYCVKEDLTKLSEPKFLHFHQVISRYTG
jgi:hypothetical protein